jgi:hypothetical protein
VKNSDRPDRRKLVSEMQTSPATTHSTVKQPRVKNKNGILYLAIAWMVGSGGAMNPIQQTSATTTTFPSQDSGLCHTIDSCWQEIKVSKDNAKSTLESLRKTHPSKHQVTSAAAWLILTRQLSDECFNSKSLPTCQDSVQKLNRLEQANNDF